MSNPSRKFNGEIEFEWTHSWISPEDLDFETILFVRDPRASLYSRFKREEKFLNYEEYVRVLDSNTLLPRHQFLDLFYRSWLSNSKISVVKFEEYKGDDFKTLFDLLIKMNLTHSSAQVRSACELSTFEKAFEAEEKYLAETGKSTNKTLKIIRAGSTEEWRDTTLTTTNKRISLFCGNSMNKLGYLATLYDGGNEILTKKCGIYQNKIVDFGRMRKGFSPEYSKEFFQKKTLISNGFNKSIYSKRESVTLFWNLFKFLPSLDGKFFFFIIWLLSIVSYLLSRVFNSLKVKRNPI